MNNVFLLLVTISWKWPNLQKKSFHLTADLESRLPALMEYFFPATLQWWIAALLCSSHTHSWSHSARQTGTDTLWNDSYRRQLFKGCHVITAQRLSSSEALDSLRLDSGSTWESGGGSQSTITQKLMGFMEETSVLQNSQEASKSSPFNALIHGKMVTRDYWCQNGTSIHIHLWFTSHGG